MEIFLIDLQLHAGEEGNPTPPASVDNPATSPAPETPASTATPPVVTGVENYDPTTATAEDRKTIIEGWLKGADPEPPVVPSTEPIATPPATPPTNEPQVNIPDKFISPDGSVNLDAFVKSYLFAEKKITEQGEELRTLRGQSTPQGTPLSEQSLTPEAPVVPPTKEELDKIKEQWFDKFYEDPQEALRELLSGAVKDAVDPILAPISPVIQDFQTRQATDQWAKEAQKVAEKYPDFDAYADTMTALIEGMSPQQFAAIPNAMETVFLMAKGLTPAPVVPKLEDSLKDPAFIKALADNPEIRRAVLATTATNINSERRPQVIGDGLGGVPPAAPPQDIRSVNDATRASREFFQKHLTGG